MLPTKFGVNWPFNSEEGKNRFSRWQPWWPSWISYLNDFSYYCSIRHPDASYQVSSQLAFWFRRRSENRFSRQQQWRPSWISDQNNFSYFCSTSHPDASYQDTSHITKTRLYYFDPLKSHFYIVKLGFRGV